MGQPLFDLIVALSSIPGLPPTAREVAILVVGAKFKADYETYAHKIIGEKRGLSRFAAAEIAEGRCPQSLDQKGRTCFDVAHRLVNVPGPLSDDSWARAVDVFGVDGVKAIVNYVGYYSYICVVLNGFDVKVPHGDSRHAKI